MNIVELAIIGSEKTEKEKLFSLLSDEPLRKFQGLKFGYLNLDDDKSIHFYFLNQEKESYLYLWDLIIPHSLAVIVVCDGDDPQILSDNLSVIAQLENTYSTPYFICPFNNHDNIMQEMVKIGIDTKEKNRILKFENTDKESVKKLLAEVFSFLTND
jgi:signal recognition particle receptor subunit beta